MIELLLPDMSCGHCQRAVTEAIQEIDPQARVQVDLGTRKVQIESQAAEAALKARLALAGYPAAAT